MVCIKPAPGKFGRISKTQQGWSLLRGAVTLDSSHFSFDWGYLQLPNNTRMHEHYKQICTVQLKQRGIKLICIRKQLRFEQTDPNHRCAPTSEHLINVFITYKTFNTRSSNKSWISIVQVHSEHCCLLDVVCSDSFIMTWGSCRNISVWNAFCGNGN